jgi:hypothetical protein
MIFIDINFGQKGQIPGHMNGQISHITKMCSFNSMVLLPKSHLPQRSLENGSR